MFLRIRFIIGVLVASLALVATSLVSGASAGAVDAPAPPTAPAVAAYYNYYGAISLAMTGGAVGWAYDYGTKWQALRSAQRACKSRSSYPWSCEKVAWVRNGCLAVAVNWDGDYIDYYGWGVANTKRQAYWRALDECGYGCVKRAYTCTTH